MFRPGLGRQFILTPGPSLWREPQWQSCSWGSPPCLGALCVFCSLPVFPPSWSLTVSFPWSHHLGLLLFPSKYLTSSCELHTQTGVLFAPLMNSCPSKFPVPLIGPIILAITQTEKCVSFFDSSVSYFSLPIMSSLLTKCFSNLLSIVEALSLWSQHRTKYRVRRDGQQTRKGAMGCRPESEFVPPAQASQEWAGSSHLGVRIYVKTEGKVKVKDVERRVFSEVLS